MTEFEKRFFSAKERRHDAKTGAAMPGGRYPIHNRRDLVHAEELMHHSSDPSAVAAHIRARAKALGIKKRLNRIMKDWSSYDQGRGAGEKTGRLAGSLAGAGAGIKAAKFGAKALRGRGFGPRVGAAAVAGYGTYQGVKAAGGYLGRKIDNAVGRVFKGLSGLTGLLDPNSPDTPLGTYQGMRQGRGRKFAGPSRSAGGPDITKAHAAARAKAKVARTMHEWGQGTLHSGSKHGPHVSSQKQAVAIALNQAGLSKALGLPALGAGLGLGAGVVSSLRASNRKNRSATSTTLHALGGGIAGEIGGRVIGAGLKAASAGATAL